MRWSALLLLSFLSNACAQAVPPLPREFRAAWVATVDNIDWPSRPKLTPRDARAELDAILDRARDLSLNALVFQVRAAGDAFYPSKLEPWSEWLTGTQGRAPSPVWDPLAHAIAGAHARGLELHAWINPFRARHKVAKTPLAAPHLGVRSPKTMVAYDGYQWFDPGQELARQHALAVVADLVARYDLDGIHYDDYFYPYPQKGQAFGDGASFAAYQQAGGELALADWRRSNIDALVQQLFEAVKRQKPWVKVGISPFGVARPGLPASIKAGIDQYKDLYADTQKWLKEGWCDYMSPQLYWPIDQAPQSFAVLAPWWAQQNPKGRHIWPGLSLNRIATAKPPVRADELAADFTILRRTEGITGNVLFSFKSLAQDRGKVATQLQALYPEPAAVPPSPWLKGEDPAKLDAQLARRDKRLVATWQPRPDLRFIAVQARTGANWRTVAIVDAAAGTFAMPAQQTDELALTALDRREVAAPPTRLTVK